MVIDKVREVLKIEAEGILQLIERIDDHVFTEMIKLICSSKGRLIIGGIGKSGIIGKIHDLYYSTVGNGTSVGNSKRFGEEIGKLLVAAGVQAVIMTST